MAQTYNTSMVTPDDVRGSYVHVFTPKETDRPDPDNPGQMLKLYQICLLIPKSATATIAAINACVEQAKLRGRDQKWDGEIPGNLKLPLRDGDDKSDDKSKDKAYNGHYFLNTSAEKKPGIIGPNGQPIIDPSKVKSGFWYKADINFFPFKAKGNKGVGVGINNLMLVREDEILGDAQQAPEQAFAKFINNAGGSQGGGFL